MSVGPRCRLAVAGKLGYTVAREIASVAVPETEKEWLAEAKTKSRRDLSATVKHAREVARREAKADPNQGELLPRPVSKAPSATVPIRVTFELSPLEYARYEVLIAKAKHTGNKAKHTGNKANPTPQRSHPKPAAKS